jgi:hypothetical protein
LLRNWYRVFDFKHLRSCPINLQAIPTIARFFVGSRYSLSDRTKKKKMRHENTQQILPFDLGGFIRIKFLQESKENIIKIGLGFCLINGIGSDMNTTSGLLNILYAVKNGYADRECLENILKFGSLTEEQIKIVADIRKAQQDASHQNENIPRGLTCPTASFFCQPPPAQYNEKLSERITVLKKYILNLEKGHIRQDQGLGWLEYFYRSLNKLHRQNIKEVQSLENIVNSLRYKIEINHYNFLSEKNELNELDAFTGACQSGFQKSEN